MENIVKRLENVHILGVLEQINKTNYMIDLHKLHQEDSMVQQFERQRDSFLEELTTLLASLLIEAQLKMAA